jgi:hypothetical protein
MEDDEIICGTCNGSGEGSSDCSTCTSCGGSGVDSCGGGDDFHEPDEPDFDEGSVNYM